MLTRIAILGFLFCLPLSVSWGQSCNAGTGNNKACTIGDVNISMSVHFTTMLELVTNTYAPPSSNLKSTDYDGVGAGKAVGSVTIKAYANGPTKVTLTSPVIAGYSGLAWSLNGGAFSSPAAVLPATGAINGAQFIVAFKLLLSWTGDAPGTFTPTPTFSITAAP
jgi:hypothetical protein